MSPSLSLSHQLCATKKNLDFFDLQLLQDRKVLHAPRSSANVIMHLAANAF